MTSRIPSVVSLVCGFAASLVALAPHATRVASSGAQAATQGTPTSVAATAQLESRWFEGRVLNGTEGYDETPGALVRLIPLSDAAPAEVISTTLGSDGTFRVAEPQVRGAVEYGLVVRYAGVDYVYPEPIAPGPADPVASPLTITVYEPSTDAAIRARTAHVVLEPDPVDGIILVTEVWVVGNLGDRTRVSGGESGLLRLLLPQDAQAVALSDPRDRASAVRTATEVVVHEPVPPGEREVVLSYQVPYAGRSFEYVQVAPLDTEEIRLMVASDSADLQSSVLAETETMQMSGRTVVSAVGGPLLEGARIDATVSGLPEPAARRLVGVPSESPVGGAARLLSASAIALSLAGVAGAFALAFLHAAKLRGRRRALATRELDTAISELSELERRRRAGEVPGADYEQRRARLVERAVCLRRAIDDNRGSE